MNNNENEIGDRVEAGASGNAQGERERDFRNYRREFEDRNEWRNDGGIRGSYGGRHGKYSGRNRGGYGGYRGGYGNVWNGTYVARNDGYMPMPMRGENYQNNRPAKNLRNGRGF